MSLPSFYVKNFLGYEPGRQVSSTDKASIELAQSLIKSCTAEWQATDSYHQLNTLTDRIIEERGNLPITNIVILGIGVVAWNDMMQFVVSTQVCAKLITRWPNLATRISVQDPTMEPGTKDAFHDIGYTVVEHPAAFALIGEGTALLSMYVPMVSLLQGVRNRPFDKIGLYWGSDMRAMAPTGGIELLRNADKFYERTNFADAPDIVNKSSSAFKNLGFWWRPENEEDLIKFDYSDGFYDKSHSERSLRIERKL